jgi:putative hydrolase of the HAD superfamily
MTWLLCDYGEVLSLPPSPEDRATLEKAAGRHGDGFWTDYWAHRPAYDRADISVADYWAAVLGRPVEPEWVRHLIELDVASWLHPNPSSLDAAQRAHDRGLRLAILSNAPVEVATAIDGAEWLRGFSPRLFSWQLRAIKPEPAAFVAAVDVLQAKPEEILFLDDRADNVAAATRLGIRAYLFEDPRQFDDLSAV